MPIESWRYHTLETLENNSWGDPATAPTGLVRRCMELRKIPLDDFKPGDLRVMIGQQIGLPYLVPIAIEKLAENIFVDAEFYEGDLLNAVMEIDESFWDKHEAWWRQLYDLVGHRRGEMEEMGIKMTKFESAKFLR